MGFLDNIVNSTENEIESNVENKINSGISSSMNHGKQQQGEVTKCPKCSATLPNPMPKFCPKCGTKLSLTCPKCEQSFPLGTVFCPDDGSKLS